MARHLGRLRGHMIPMAKGDTSNDDKAKGEPGGEQPEAKTFHVTFLLS
jgi:hypothetical protein